MQSIRIPKDYTSKEVKMIPETVTKIFSSSDKRFDKDQNFSFNGVMMVLSGPNMDHTLGIFFAGEEYVDVVFNSEMKQIEFFTDNGKILSLALDELNWYGDYHERIAGDIRKLIPQYNGRLMYDFKQNVLKGGLSFGSLGAIAVPFNDGREQYIHDVPDSIRDRIFKRYD